MSHKKNKSKKDTMNALANMGANMSAMLSGDSPLTDTQYDNAEVAEIGTTEKSQSSVPANQPVTNPTQEASVQSAEGADVNDGTETEVSSVNQGESETFTPTSVEINIDIDKTQGNAIYSSLLGVQNSLDNFQIDVKQGSMREVVREAVMQAVEDYMKEEDKKQKEQEEKLRAEGKPTNTFEAFQRMTTQYTDALNKFSHNSKAIKNQYRGIADSLCELLGQVNLAPYEKPKFKDESGHLLLNSLYLFPWYYFKCFYSSKYVRGFIKTLAWSVWLISLGLLFFIARDNADLHKQQNINRYVHAYFSDNAEVMMELEGIDFMFSDQKVKPMPVKEYREYMKERKKEAKGSKQK